MGIRQDPPRVYTQLVVVNKMEASEELLGGGGEGVAAVGWGLHEWIWKGEGRKAVIFQAG